MKTSKILIPVLVSCLAVFVGCGDKDNDFRDTWVGTYEGYSDYHFSTGTDHQFDTVYTNESLSVSKQETVGLVIDYLGQSFPVSCTSEGTFTSSSNNPHSEWNGCIKGDSLFFNYHDVSQGYSSTRLFKGKKTN
ncbi:MAG: hypothetical protein J6031_00295 [Bacteroidales bacterium]|nr:hypothetical protein [Bacteroidales bacterium]